MWNLPYDNTSHERLHTVFYAHPIAYYDSDIERNDINLLQRMGFKVLSPHGEDNGAMYRELGMKYSLVLLSKCDMVAFRAYEDQVVGAGVQQELEWATQLGMPIIELPSLVTRKSLGIIETRERNDEIMGN